MSNVAKEIDASICSHSPLAYSLRAILVEKPDYSDVIVKHHIPASQAQQDPRLRRYSGKGPEKPSLSKSPEYASYNPSRELGGSSNPGFYQPPPAAPKPARRDPRRRD